MGDKSIYFFDQIDPRKDKIRQRKSTVDLPASLRQGYVRAAELIRRAQINQANASTDVSPQSQTKEVKKEPVEENTNVEVKGNDWRTSKGYFTGENGLKFAALPVIPTEQYVQVGLASKDEKYDLEFVEEDTQRFLLEEAKFAFPGVLVQISKLLHLFYDQNINIDVSDELRKQLFYTFDQLSKHAVYNKREWQTAIYRDLALGQKEEAAANAAKDEDSQGRKRHKLKYSRLSKISIIDENIKDRKEDSKIKEGSKLSTFTNTSTNRKLVRDNEFKITPIAERANRASTNRDRTRCKSRSLLVTTYKVNNL